MGGRKKQADHRADTRGKGYAGIPAVVIESPAYRSLSLYARAILVEMALEMKGYRNGSIALSQRELGDRLASTNYRAIGRAIAELVEHGLIDVTAEGEWKQRMARQYRLTFVNTTANGKHVAATNDYRFFSVDDVSAGKVKSADDVSTGRKKSADDVLARIARESQKRVKSSHLPADDVSSLIGKPYPPQPSEGGEGVNGTSILPESARGEFDCGDELWSDDMRPPDDIDQWPPEAEYGHDKELSAWLREVIPDLPKWSWDWRKSATLARIVCETGIDGEWLHPFIAGQVGMFPKHVERLREWRDRFARDAV